MSMNKVWFLTKKFFGALKDAFIAAVDPVYYQKCLNEARQKEQKEEVRRLIEYCQQ